MSTEVARSTLRQAGYRMGITEVENGADPGTVVAMGEPRNDRVVVDVALAPEGDVEVVESGGSVFPEWETGSYAVVLENTDTVRVATDITVSVTWRTDAGVLSDSHSIAAMMPGQTTAVADSLFDVTDVAELPEAEVVVSVSEWFEPDGEPGSFEISDVTVSGAGEGRYDADVRGSIASDYVEDMESVLVTAVVREGEQIVGGDYTYVDIVPAGGSVGFEVMMSAPVPGSADVDVYTQLSYTSLW